jgi:hypothetical protein
VRACVRASERASERVCVHSYLTTGFDLCYVSPRYCSTFCNTALRLVLASAAVQQSTAETLLEGFRTLNYAASSFQNTQVRSQA